MHQIPKSWRLLVLVMPDVLPLKMGNKVFEDKEIIGYNKCH
jgi:hypothetical protein